jgi:hypothetical protein
MTGLIISAKANAVENRLAIRFEFNGLLLGCVGFASIILQILGKPDDLVLFACSGIVDS